VLTGLLRVIEDGIEVGIRSKAEPSYYAVVAPLRDEVRAVREGGHGWHNALRGHAPRVHVELTTSG